MHGTATAAGDLFQARAFGVSPLGSLRGLGTTGDGLAQDQLPAGGASYAPNDFGSGLIGGVGWAAPAFIGGAVTGLVASSDMRGALQGAMWAGGGAALVYGLYSATSLRNPAGWLFAAGGTALAGLAAYRAWRK